MTDSLQKEGFWKKYSVDKDDSSSGDNNSEVKLTEEDIEDLGLPVPTKSKDLDKDEISRLATPAIKPGQLPN